MLRELRRRKQQVADKIGHEEYIYRLNGDPFRGEENRRVRPQGNIDPHRGDVHRPPFAVDDDDGDCNRGGNNNNGRPAAPPNPVTGAPVAGAGGGGGEGKARNDISGAALVPFRNANNPNGNYASPYGPPLGGYNNNNNYGGGYVAALQPIVPVMPPMAPISELPGPLPAIYHPKPPLTFHSNGAGPSFPPSQLPCPAGNGGSGGNDNGWLAAPMPNYGREDGARPNTSPTVIPPLSPIRAGGGGDGYNNNGGGCRSPRPSTSGVPAAGNLIVGSSDLSEAEDRYREKMAARKRAIELQQENARQALEQQQRKQAERERQIKEDREAESRLRREREEVARREQAEVDRENRERELKMMGPRAAQEALEQQRKETEARREAEAAARRNRGKPTQKTDTPTVVPAQTEDDKASEAPAEGTSISNASVALPPSQTTPLEQRGPISFTSTLRPASLPSQPGTHTTQQYFANIGLGGAGLAPPPPPPPSPIPNPLYYAAPYMMQQRQQCIHLESDVIHEELRHISLLLEAQQLNNAITHNTSPPPWMSGPPPSTAAGAGTYLTTGLPSPIYNVNSNDSKCNSGCGGTRVPQQGSGELRSSPLPPNSSGGYRSLWTGGSLPPIPLATAVSPQSSSSVPGGRSSPWQGLFSSSSPPPPAYANTHGPHHNGFGGSYCGDGVDAEELAIEPSHFVMPAAVPPTLFIPAAVLLPPVAAAATPADGMTVSSASFPAGEFSLPTRVDPEERPSTGKPATPPSSTAAAPLSGKTEKSSATVPTIHISSLSVAPATTPRDVIVSTDAVLARSPESIAASDSPVRGTTSYPTSTTTLDEIDAQMKDSPVSSAPPVPASLRSCAASMEPPIVISTPRSRGEVEDEL